MFPSEHTINLEYEYGDKLMGLTVEGFLLHALDFIEDRYESIERYYEENGLELDPSQVAQETWDMLLDGSYERP